jgi:hypothetical protein
MPLLSPTYPGDGNSAVRNRKTGEKVMASMLSSFERKTECNLQPSIDDEFHCHSSSLKKDPAISTMAVANAADIPQDVYLCILSYCSFSTLLALRSCSKTFRDDLVPKECRHRDAKKRALVKNNKNCRRRTSRKQLVSDWEWSSSRESTIDHVLKLAKDTFFQNGVCVVHGYDEAAVKTLLLGGHDVVHDRNKEASLGFWRVEATFKDAALATAIQWRYARGAGNPIHTKGERGLSLLFADPAATVTIAECEVSKRSPNSNKIVRKSMQAIVFSTLQNSIRVSGAYSSRTIMV